MLICILRSAYLSIEREKCSVVGESGALEREKERVTDRQREREARISTSSG